MYSINYETVRVYTIISTLNMSWLQLLASHLEKVFDFSKCRQLHHIHTDIALRLINDHEEQCIAAIWCLETLLCSLLECSSFLLTGLSIDIMLIASTYESRLFKHKLSIIVHLFTKPKTKLRLAVVEVQFRQPYNTTRHIDAAISHAFRDQLWRDITLSIAPPPLI